MRLSNYLLEDDSMSLDNVMSGIQSGCGQFLKEFKKPIFRGIENYPDFGNRVPRRDRRSLSLGDVLHSTFDICFDKVFGWKPRSQGVFATGDDQQANIYGDVYYFFPLDGYEYIWSPEVEDLYTDITDILMESGVFKYRGEIQDSKYWEYWNLDRIDKLTKWIKSNYKNKNYNKDNEIMFKCSGYYYIHKKHVKIKYEDLYKKLTEK